MAKEQEGPTGPVEPEYISQEEIGTAVQVGILLPPEALQVSSFFIDKCLNCDRDTLFAVVPITPDSHDALLRKQAFYFCSLCGQYTEIK